MFLTKEVKFAEISAEDVPLIVGEIELAWGKELCMSDIMPSRKTTESRCQIFGLKPSADLGSRAFRDRLQLVL
jgi:hypothetical protein